MQTSRKHEPRNPATAGGAPRPAAAAALPAPRRVRAYGYIGVVCGLAAWVLVRNAPDLREVAAALALWLVVNLLAELLWLPTVTGRATSSMASTANFATLFLLGPRLAIWPVAVAAGLATSLFQRRPPLKSMFNLAQTAVAMAAAGWFFTETGGRPVTLAALQRPVALLVPFLNAGAVYFLVNTALVAAVVGFWEGQPALRVWRQNYGYADDLLTSLTLFLLSPLMVMAYLAVGMPGLVCCFLPMLLVRNASRRYIEIEQTQQALLWNERMAAMGEMAAEIGHELGNVLQVISGQAQMLLTDADGVRGERAKRAVRHIFERAIDIRRLTKGLVDFSHRDVLPRQLAVGGLIRETVELVQPQNMYDGIEWKLELAAEEPPMLLDGGQLRQVLVNLYRNAAEAMAGQAERRLTVRTRRREERLVIEVIDNGPGIPPELVERVFEPWLTTKTDGHGFGLAVSYRIVHNHGGTIRALNREGGGAAVVIELPVAGDRQRAARPAA